MDWIPAALGFGIAFGVAGLAVGFVYSWSRRHIKSWVWSFLLVAASFVPCYLLAAVVTSSLYSVLAPDQSGAGHFGAAYVQAIVSLICHAYALVFVVLRSRTWYLGPKPAQSERKW